jgi:hypothetical protein
LPIFAALNLPLIKECADYYQWERIDQILQSAGMAAPPVPVAGERTQQRKEEEEEAMLAQRQQWQEAEQRRREAQEVQRLEREKKAKRLALQAQKIARDTSKKGGRGKQGALWEDTEIDDDIKKRVLKNVLDIYKKK